MKSLLLALSMGISANALAVTPVSTTWGLPSAALISDGMITSDTAVLIPNAATPGTPPSNLGTLAIAMTTKGTICTYNNSLARWETVGYTSSGVTLLGIGVLTTLTRAAVPCDWSL